MKNTILIIFLTVLLFACGRQPKDLETPEYILPEMRAYTTWIHELDSLAQIAIGPGAKCMDPVWHTFSYDNRLWFFNQDWGGVLEIPADYVPQDDLVQAELSFHGTSAWSPDSLIFISFYSGFQALTDDEAREAMLSGLAEYGFTIQDSSETDGALTIRARSAEGINYYGRHIFANKDGIEYSVSVQYPDNKTPEAHDIMKMADRYPAGPNGNIFKGEAL